MPVEKHKHQNESFINKKIANLLYPTIFSLMMTLNAPAQAKDSKLNTEKQPAQQEVVQDTLFIKSLEKILNKLSDPGLSESERKHFTSNFIQGLDLYFNDASDSSHVLTKDNIYIKKNGVDNKVENFLQNFYKESYRSAGKLTIHIKSLYKEKNKLYISIEYALKAEINSKSNP